jgi:hypothetical protein
LNVVLGYNGTNTAKYGNKAVSLPGETINNFRVEEGFSQHNTYIKTVHMISTLAVNQILMLNVTGYNAVSPDPYNLQVILIHELSSIDSGFVSIERRQRLCNIDGHESLSKQPFHADL